MYELDQKEIESVCKLRQIEGVVFVKCAKGIGGLELLIVCQKESDLAELAKTASELGARALKFLNFRAEDFDKHDSQATRTLRELLSFS